MNTSEDCSDIYDWRFSVNYILVSKVEIYKFENLSI